MSKPIKARDARAYFPVDGPEIHGVRFAPGVFAKALRAWDRGQGKVTETERGLLIEGKLSEADLATIQVGGRAEMSLVARLPRAGSTK